MLLVSLCYVDGTLLTEKTFLFEYLCLNFMYHVEFGVPITKCDAILDVLSFREKCAAHNPRLTIVEHNLNKFKLFKILTVLFTRPK